MDKTHVSEGVSEAASVMEQMEISPEAAAALKEITGDTVAVYVGPDRFRFDMHQTTICKAKYFKNALNGLWWASKSRDINLPNDDPVTFAAIVNSLYDRPIATNPTSLRWIELIKVWVVADKYNLTNLCRKVLLILKEKDLAARDTQRNAPSLFSNILRKGFAMSRRAPSSISTITPLTTPNSGTGLQFYSTMLCPRCSSEADAQWNEHGSGHR